ncbi:MAG: hypothetical protein IKA11_04320 [Clostridia bacterium]|nr:hypothetical protein [Clostridia bacterium]
MEKFGLIGKTLKHSYSKIIHGELGNYDYDLYEIAPENLKEFVLSGKLKGYNVTIPYKKDIIPYLDEVDERALKIGAVNTVVEKDGKRYGFNTDFLGMKYMLSRAGITLKDKVVMLLGSGGTSNTANAVVLSDGAKEVIKVSRTGEVNYQNCFERKDVEVIINTTPVGMFPNNYESPLSISGFPNLIGVADVIYNPNLTALTAQAKERGIKYANGLPMLVAQAKYAMELFLDKTVSDSVIEKVLSKLEKETLNIVLIGMPGSGKTTVGKALAELLGREFIDTDLEIEKRENRDIPLIFKENGEEYFRAAESAVLKEVGLMTGKVIATGGGVIKNKDNYFPLKSNGVIFWIKRDLSALPTDGRPLSKDVETLKKLFDERKDLYAFFADEIIENDTDIEKVVKEITDKL